MRIRDPSSAPWYSQIYGLFTVWIHALVSPKDSRLRLDVYLG
jgi:hypothetical protein